MGYDFINLHVYNTQLAPAIHCMLVLAYEATKQFKFMSVKVEATYEPKYV
jgi:hypothetical protein